jgi:hypothetical protein
MSGTKNDLTGKKFGRLTVIRRDGVIYDHRSAWHCVCSCGGTTRVSSSSLTRGNVKSCGCLKSEHGKKWVNRSRRFGNSVHTALYEGGSIEDLEDLIR